MRWVFAGIIAIHGLIHLMGPAKAFGYADLPQLTQPISRGMGLVWLAAAVLTLATVVALFVWPRGWWMIGAVALVLSQAVIFTSWSDAKAGTAGQRAPARRRGLRLLHAGPDQLPRPVRARRAGWTGEADRRAGADRRRSRAAARSGATLPPRDRDGRTAAHSQLPRPHARPHPQRSRCAVDAVRGRPTELRGQAHPALLDARDDDGRAHRRAAPPRGRPRDRCASSRSARSPSSTPPARRWTRARRSRCSTTCASLRPGRSSTRRSTWEPLDARSGQGALHARRPHDLGDAHLRRRGAAEGLRVGRSACVSGRQDVQALAIVNTRAGLPVLRALPARRAGRGPLASARTASTCTPRSTYWTSSTTAASRKHPVCRRALLRPRRTA